jgi:cytochrome c peroxidase
MFRTTWSTSRRTGRFGVAKPLMAVGFVLLAMGGLVAARAESAALEEPSTRSGVSASGRIPPRAKLTDEEYTKLAAELREVYSKPPETWPAPDLDAGVEHREIGRLPDVVHPENNPYSKEKAELGRTLFFDSRLSGTLAMACVSCHDADLGWADGRTTAFGHRVQPQKRNTPSILNAAFSTSQFWDGRAATLEEQALMPIANPGEMASSADDAAKRLNEVPEYRTMFKAVFGSEEVTGENLAKAIACFERTIVSPNRSRFDQFMNGRKEALSDAAVRGMHLFRTTARCLNCHSGPEFSDHQFHNLGLSLYGRTGQDLGRYEITKDPKDVGAFKTPGLRNVTRTGPYMHHGLFDSLEEAVVLYNGGGFNQRRTATQKDDPLFPNKSPLLKPLGLNDRDIADLLEFLEHLEDPRTKFRAPKVP